MPVRPISTVWLVSLVSLFKTKFKHPYHLLGPNKWSGAREAILTVQERIDAALQTNRGKAISTKAPSALATSMKNLNFFHFLIIFVVIALGFAVTLSTVLVSSIF